VTAASSLDLKINRFGLWSAIVAIATGVVAMFLPLDVPDGYNAEHVDRVAWLVENRGGFILAWVNQIVSMFSLSAVIACAAWVAAARNAFLGILGALFTAMATMAFIVPKFIAIWTIPLLADTVAAGGVGTEMADALLLMLNVTVPFSLYTSFDFLGFWLYAVAALLIAASLYGEAASSKVGAISLGLYGLIYQLLMVALLMRSIAPVDINTYFLSAAMLLIVHIVAMIFVFQSRLKEAGSASNSAVSP
jgi:hypothetical protein